MPGFRDRLTQVSHGDHCCLLYTDPGDPIRVTVPFFTLGLERDERCVYVGRPEAIEQMRWALRDEGVSVEREAERGRLVLSSDRDYLADDHFSTEKMLSFLQQAYDSALGEGFTALRAAGDVSWEIGPHEEWQDLVYYETLLDMFFLGKRMVGMCQYSKEKFPAEVLTGVLRTHRLAGVESEFCHDNVHYEAPDLLLEKNPDERQKRRVKWMTSQLVRLREAEQARERALEELLRDKQALERANLELDRLVYAASHDIRTPVRTIVSFAGMMADEPEGMSEEQRALLQRIVGAAERLQTMSDDLVNLSEMSRPERHLQVVNTGTLVNEAWARLGPAPRNVRLRVAPDLPTIACDPRRLREVFVNLLSNAMKFSSHRAVPEIEVWADTSPTRVDFCVRDNGIGIEPQYHDKVFEMFSRLNPASEYEGTGLGLYLAKRLVEMHGGTIGLESAAGAGATFRVSLPRSAGPEVS